MFCECVAPYFVIPSNCGDYSNDKISSTLLIYSASLEGIAYTV